MAKKKKDERKVMSYEELPLEEYEKQEKYKKPGKYKNRGNT